jgi:RNA polymerase sigma-70 factor (ECF subfamily)
VDEAAARAAAVARASYGRLLAILAARTGDIARAEEALAEAFARALETWPARGVPDRPEAWLLTVARNTAANAAARAGSRRAAPVEAADGIEEAMDELDPDAIPDARLRLLFVCAHPAIDAAVRTPLMLQTVLGLEAAEVARLFLVAPEAMAQRLVRAKRKIREARVPFALPLRADMPARTEAVFEAVYGALAAGLDGLGAGLPEAIGEEALFLARLLADLLPQDAEALGLAALAAHLAARGAARRDGAGAYVPLDAQDRSRWNTALQAEAERLLRRARAAGPVGRFQIEAAIQSAHVAGLTAGRVDWVALALLHEGLLRLAPSAGAVVAHALTVGQSQGPAAGLAALSRLDPQVAARFQPALAARAHLLHAAMRWAEAAEAYAAAARATPDPAVRAYLARRAAARGPDEG